MADDGRYRCLGCDELLERDQLVCDRCEHEHVDAEELWAIALLSPAVFLLFAVLVVWALETFVPGTFGVLGPRGVVAVIAALWAVAFLQFSWDHLRYRRALRRRGTLEPFPREMATEEALEQLRLTVRIGAGTALVGLVGGLLGPGPGYGLALRLAELAGFGLLGFGGVVVYRLRAVLHPIEHARRLADRVETRMRRATAAVVGAGRRAATGARPYVTDVVRGSRSVADDLHTAAGRVDAVRRSLSAERGLPVGTAGARETSREFSASWREATASMDRHWPAWGVAGIVETWTVLFLTGIGVTYITETMVVTWLLYSYFLFEDVALTRERYDWDAWWWAYSVAGLLPIVNIGVGAVYLLRRELLRRGTESSDEGEETEE